MRTVGLSRAGLAALAFLAAGTVASAEDLPFAYIGPDVPSLAEYTLADDGGAGAGEVRCFIAQAGRFGGETVELAQLAVQRAQRPAVRRFAAELAKRQAWMNAELAALAERRGMRLPGVSDFDRRAWMRKPAEEFERDFLARLIELHVTATARFEAAVQQTDDDEISAYAAKCLPWLQEHARRLEELAGQT